MKNCADCGTAWPTQAAFCGGCGMPLTLPKQPSQANPTPQTPGRPTTSSAQPPRQKPAKGDGLEMLGQAGASAMKAGCALFFAVPLLLFVVVVIGGLLFG